MAIVSTKGNKDDRINFKIRPTLKIDFQAAAELMESSMSALLHQFIVKTVREVRERDPQAFAEMMRQLTATETNGFKPPPYTQSDQPTQPYYSDPKKDKGKGSRRSRLVKKDIADAREDARKQREKAKGKSSD